MRDELWQARRAALETCAYMGMTLKEASVDTGLSVATARLYRRRYGIKFCQKIGRKPLDVDGLRVKLQPLADSGLTLAEAADELGVHYATVVRQANTAGVSFRRPVDGSDPERAAAMASMYKAGKTLAEIGDMYRLTRERVRQIISKFHRLTGNDGGAAMRAKIERDRRKAKREAVCLLKHGCSLAQLSEIKKIGSEMQAAGAGYARTPLGAYRSQMHNSRKRGIEWKISLWEWWTIWQESGHWDDRGRGTGYMMCRFGDTGAYELGNVYIATGVHNGSVQPNNPYRKDHPDFDRAIADKNARRVECSRAAA